MKNRVVILLMLLIGLGVAMSGQRRITPVEAPPVLGKGELRRETKISVDSTRFVRSTDADGNVILVDTVTGREVIDSVALKAKKEPKTVYPLFNAIDLGVDIWDPMMRAFGQKYGLIGVSAGLNLHNRFRPILEVGLGDASYTPEDGNFTYKGKMAPFFKLGIDYNFMYKSNGDYEAFLGARYGLSPFSYEITNVALDSEYWGEENRFDIPSQSVTVSYFELLFGIKVKLWKDFALGWTLKYHSIINDGNPKYGKPWYIPGYGTRSGAWAGAFSIYYTIPLNKRPEPVVEIQQEK